MAHRGIRNAFVLLLMLGGVAAISSVQAKDWVRPRHLGPLLSEMTLDMAVDRVRKRTGARVLSADTVQDDGRRVHEVKILTDEGTVRRYRIDGDSGEQLRPQGRKAYPGGNRQVRPSNGRSGEPPSSQRWRRP